MDRRPLASRGTKWANDLAKFISKMNISPNDISILSVVFSMLAFLFYYLSIENFWYLILAVVCIQMRLVCNLLDGMVAIEYNKKSIYGNLFNDIPDRFADVFIIMGAGLYSHYKINSSGVGLNLAWINSILAILTAYIRVLGSSVGTPMFFAGIMAKPQRMAILTIATLLTLIPNIQFPFLYIALILMIIGQCLTVAMRIKLIANDLKQKSIK